MISGTLVITGDEFDNIVWISSVNDEVTVQGIRTAVNGNSEPATFTNVARIEVIGGDGDDSVQAFLGQTLSELETVAELRIDTGSGRDGVHVQWGTDSDVFVDTGDGADVAGVFSAFGDHGDGELQIVTGDGADLVFLDLRFHTEGAVVVDTGNGNDSMEVMFEGGLSAGSLSVFMGNGNDSVTLHATLGGVNTDLAIEGGNGIDSLFYNPNYFIGEVDVLNFED
jgi:hypothetical protein